MTDIDELKTKVFEALGAASMCWEEDGVFMDERATKIGDELIADLKPLLDELDLLRDIAKAYGNAVVVASDKLSTKNDIWEVLGTPTNGGEQA